MPMIRFFRTSSSVYAVHLRQPLPAADQDKLIWLFGNAEPMADTTLPGFFVGPRQEMITPWSTNAVEITQSMGIAGIVRIEEFSSVPHTQVPYDKMLQRLYNGLDQEIFTVQHTPEPVVNVHDLAAYNAAEGLALSEEEIAYLEGVSRELGRPLTDSEVFGFSQVNSEHCRHKIFNGTFIIDGQEKSSTLFQLIKKTARENPNFLVSAYKDNVAFIKGPRAVQFAPARPDVPDYFQLTDFDAVLSLKAETHNFPTTVEPFNGAATGGGGEIRDRLAGGKGSLPLAGTAVYITSYPRLENGRPWENAWAARPWLYQTPAEILIKASDGASDFGNKFGQPLIAGSVLTFEHFENNKKFAFDKVIMLAGGVGYAKEKDSQKGKVQPGDKLVLMGGDNYRIGMGGAAVSSVTTGAVGSALELNAIQRSNPEMQKRVMNAIRAMVESEHNPIVSIHDHGAGGHLNCFSELLEETGGTIEMDQLPVGDPTLSAREIISNESQERMGLALREDDIDLLRRTSERERAPLYVVGTATGDQHFTFIDRAKNAQPVSLAMRHLFGSSPKTILQDHTVMESYRPVAYHAGQWISCLHQVLQLESVACKDWLTNKVDRSVTGRVATQQTCGPLQLPLNNVAVMALDFTSQKGIATGIGHAPAATLVDPQGGSQLAIAEALLNIIWAPLTHGLRGVSLSANWMWPAKYEGENARLYEAVQAVSDFACALGINIPTGKDSLSMTQKYPDGNVVLSPGTVIISAVAEVSDIRKTLSPALQPVADSSLIRIDFSKDEGQLGGSSLGQIMNRLGERVPRVNDVGYFARAFAAVQELIGQELLLAGHDISSGGLITTVLEMCFPVPGAGATLTLPDHDLPVHLFSENPGVVLQVHDTRALDLLQQKQIDYIRIGTVRLDGILQVNGESLAVDELRSRWFHTSYLLDRLQRPRGHAEQRKERLFQQPLHFHFPPAFTGRLASWGIDPHRRTPTGVRAAIIREKGVNGDREMAWALYLAGFDVKDVHMTDLMQGREDLREVNLIVFVGGFSNSDVLGSAKGWAGAFRYNDHARAALDEFYQRPDTLSLGVCNGCQLMMELGLVYREQVQAVHPKMHVNGSGKFESAFVNLTIPENKSVMLGSLAGARLGVWVAHGEGRFVLKNHTGYQVAATYSYTEYPGNPNDSDFAVAALTSADGRHLAMMPHLERSLYPWNWGYYPNNRPQDEVSPWIEAFVNAREWVVKNRSLQKTASHGKTGSF